MKTVVPLLLVGALAAVPAAGKTVISGKSDDQRVTEGVAGPVEAARPSKDKPQTGAAAETTRHAKDKKQKAQHPPPPPLHDPN